MAWKERICNTLRTKQKLEVCFEPGTLPHLYSSPCQICTGAHNMNRWTNVIRRALRMCLSPECISPKVDLCICYELEVSVYLPTKKWLTLLSLYPIRPYGFKERERAHWDDMTGNNVLHGKGVQGSTEEAQALRGSNFWNMMLYFVLAMLVTWEEHWVVKVI